MNTTIREYHHNMETIVVCSCIFKHSLIFWFIGKCSGEKCINSHKCLWPNSPCAYRQMPPLTSSCLPLRQTNTWSMCPESSVRFWEKTIKGWMIRLSDSIISDIFTDTKTIENSQKTRRHKKSIMPELLKKMRNCKVKRKIDNYNIFYISNAWISTK